MQRLFSEGVLTKKRVVGRVEAALTNVSEHSRVSEFESRLVYRASSRTARATQGNPLLKNKNKKPGNKQNTRFLA